MRPFSLIFLIAYFLCPFFIVAQEDPLKVQITPPSPEAASLGKFIDIPVSPYTGIPKVEIPVYEMKSYELTLPIKLKYHASGIRMEELASFAGTGWSLDAGGIVSRTIRGLSDEYNGYPYLGFLSQSPLTDFSVDPFFTASGGWNHSYFNNNVQTMNGGNCNGPSEEEYDNILFASRGGLDLEPDLFFFSLPDGQSGKFVFSRDGTMNFIPKQFVDISYGVSSGEPRIEEWTITGRDGTRYLFTDLETSENQSLCQQATGMQVELGQPDLPLNMLAPTSWRNTMIISASGLDTIFFEYENETLQYEITSETTTYSYYNGSYPTPEPSNCGSRLVVGSKRLKKIRCSAGYEVTFEANTNRLDINGGKKLDGIRISYKGDEFKSFELMHNYESAGSGYDEKRLMLTSIQEVQNEIHTLPPYEFTYFPQQMVSFKRSNPNVDHWGYSNGETTNLYKSPSVIFNDSYFTGDNREPDLFYAQQWSLKKIEYPTGGTTEFEYELNDYSNIPVFPAQTFRYSPGLEELASIEFQISSDINANYSDTEYFTLSSAKDVVFVYEIPQIPGGGIPASGCGGELTCSSPLYLKYFNQPGPLVQPIEELAAGSYTLTAEFDPSLFDWQGTDLSTLEFYIKVYRVRSLEELVANNSLKGGGLRIKKVTSTGENAVTKTYSYTVPGSTVSSGKLMSFPSYAYFMNFNDGEMQTGLCQYTAAGVYIARTATSNLPLTQTQGSYVGYDVVTEYHGTLQENNGYTVYRYENHPDDVSNQVSFPIAPNQSYAYKNGLLLEQTDHASSGKMVKKVVNTYRFLSPETVATGIRIAQELRTGCKYCENRAFGAAFYDHFTERIELGETITRIYDTNNDNYQEQSVVYDYNNYDQVSHSETTSGVPGKKLFTRFEYHTTDHTAVTKKSSYYSTDVNGPFEYKDGQQLAYNSFIKPTSVSILEAPSGAVPTESTNYTERLAYTHFDSRGNVLSFIRDGIEETRTSFLWGYNGLFPVAQVVNAKPGEIAYTSFENDNEGGWIYNPTYSYSGALSGFRRYSLTSGAVQTGDLNLQPGDYIVSYFATGNPTLSYSAGHADLIDDHLPPQTQGSWTLYRKIVSVDAVNTELSLSGSGYIDELRLHPVDAQMTTYTYDPATGVTCTTDINNFTTHYDYDDRNRLELVKDFELNILKRYEYHYKKDN